MSLPRRILGIAGAVLALLVLMMGGDPLLTFGLKTPHFVALSATPDDPVYFVLNDGWGLTAAIPGGLLVDWSRYKVEPAMRLSLGNPSVVPQVERVSADGRRIEAIRYRSAWPGIDAVIHAIPNGWACTMIVEPGASPSVIEMEYIGATSLDLDGQGRLHVSTTRGTWSNKAPESWQDGPSGREPVASSYELRGGNRVGFTVGPYDTSRPLVVDPPSQRIK